MTVQTSEQRAPRFTGKHMAICMVAFFGTIIVVNFTMATLASKTWTGLIVKNTYVASQQYNGKLQAAHKQDQLGWHSRLTYADGVFKISVNDKAGAHLTLENPTLFVGRPAFEREDRILTLEKGSGNTFSINTELASGEWIVTLTGKIDGQPYRRDARLLVKANGQGRIE